MRARFVFSITILLVPALSLAQDPFATTSVYRCAVGGAHLEGCVSTPICTVAPYLTHCGEQPAATPAPTPEPAPAPAPTPTPIVAPTTQPTPDPVASAPTAPTALRPGVYFEHDGANVEWFTLRLNGAYYGHVSGRERHIPLDVASLPAGTYSVTVDACNDAAGCTRSAVLAIQ